MKKEKPSGNLAGTVVEDPQGHGEKLLFAPLRTLLIAAVNCIFNLKLKFKFTDAYGNVIAIQDSDVKCSPLGMTITTPALHLPPQNGQGGLLTAFHPFKLYKPTNFSQFATGVLFNGTDGQSVTCNIDDTIPTDLTAIPPTVNPDTDAWRFWAVRSGEIELRPLYSIITTYSNNWTYQYPVMENLDGISPFDFQRTPTTLPGLIANYDDPIIATAFPPLIIGSPSGADGPGGYYQFAFWIRITPDTSSADSPTARIEARDCSLITDVFPSSDLGTIVPVGIVTFYGDVDEEPLMIDQMVFDHIRNRFPAPSGTFGAASAMNFRGSWDKDAGVFDPPDLADQIFYPGDIVSSISTSGGGFRFTVLFQVASNTPIAWTDPWTGSPQWKRAMEVIGPAI